MSASPDIREVAIKEAMKMLKAHRETMIEYLKMRVFVQDWHGVMDAAADIREIDAKLHLLSEI